MREVSCVGYTPRAWDPRSLQSILDVSLVFRHFQRPIENRGHYLVVLWSAWSFKVKQGRISPLVATLTLNA